MASPKLKHSRSGKHPFQAVVLDNMLACVWTRASTMDIAAARPDRNICITSYTNFSAKSTTCYLNSLSLPNTNARTTDITAVTARLGEQLSASKNYTPGCLSNIQAERIGRSRPPPMEIAVLLLLLLLGVAAGLKVDPDLPTPPHDADFMISRLPMSEHVQPMSELKVTDHVVELKRSNSKSLSSIYVQTMRKQSMAALAGDSRLSVRLLNHNIGGC